MKKYAEVKNHKVVNIILWDGVSPLPGSGSLRLIGDEDPVGIGWSANGTYVAPEEPPEEIPVASPTVVTDDEGDEWSIVNKKWVPV